MKHLLGGQIGLEDFIFAHRKGNNFCDIIDCKQLTLNYFIKTASAATHELVAIEFLKHIDFLQRIEFYKK